MKEEMKQWQIEDLQELKNRRQNLSKRLRKAITLDAQFLLKKQIRNIERELDRLLKVKIKR